MQKPRVKADISKPNALQYMMKNEQSLESLQDQINVKIEDESSSDSDSDSEYEVIETKIVAIDCSSIHVLTNSLQNPQPQLERL